MLFSKVPLVLEYCHARIVEGGNEGAIVACWASRRDGLHFYCGRPRKVRRMYFLSSIIVVGTALAGDPSRQFSIQNILGTFKIMYDFRLL